MRHHRYVFLLVMVVLVTAFAATARAATVDTPSKKRPSPSIGVPPPAGTQTGPKVTPGVDAPQPGGIAPGPAHVGPTANLSVVANALQLKFKSLSTLITAPPGLVLTNPVNIRVTYKSSVSGSQWIQDIYNTSTGYRKFHNDPEGNRYARQMALEFLLTEQQPGNKFVNFSFTWNINLDPLFDVSLTPLRFKLNSDCDRVGNSEIRFSWKSPEGKVHKKGFSTTKGTTVTINEFAWARQEVSASSNFFWPQWNFYDDDAIELSGAYLEGFGPQTLKLLPGWSGYVGRTIKDGHGQSCTADIAFDVNIGVRQYPNL